MSPVQCMCKRNEYAHRNNWNVSVIDIRRPTVFVCFRKITYPNFTCAAQMDEYVHVYTWEWLKQNMINSRMVMRIHTAINTSSMYMHIYTDLEAYVHAKLIHPYLHTMTPWHQWDTSERHAGIFLTRQRKRRAQTWPAHSCAEFQNCRYWTWAPSESNFQLFRFYQSAKEMYHRSRVSRNAHRIWEYVSIVTFSLQPAVHSEETHRFTNKSTKTITYWNSRLLIILVFSQSRWKQGVLASEMTFVHTHTLTYIQAQTHTTIEAHRKLPAVKG